MTYLLVGSLLFVIVFTWAVVLILRRAKGDGGDSDGGIEPWEAPPRLDLPPGVSWPREDHDSPFAFSDFEEEALA